MEPLSPKHRNLSTLELISHIILNGLVTFPLSLPKSANFHFMCGDLDPFLLLNFLIDRFVFCCILPHILYCSPIVFCGLLSKDWKIISRCLKLIAKCSGVSLTRLQEFVISKHLSSCELFASKTLSDVQHPLHLFLSNSRLPRPSRSSFKHIFARTNAYKISVIPYLALFLTNKQNVRDELFSFIHS